MAHRRPIRCLSEVSIKQLKLRKKKCITQEKCSCSKVHTIERGMVQLGAQQAPVFDYVRVL